jgi:hypothetical protein
MVIPNVGLTYPSRARVTINPSQVQLFRTEAINLSARLQQLKLQIEQFNGRADRAIIKQMDLAIGFEIAAVDRTASRFRALGSDKELQNGAFVFFSDLKLTYQQTRQSLAASHIADLRQGEHRLHLLLPLVQVQPLRLSPLVAAGVYRAFEQNQVAYNLVAQTGDILFNLRVVSSPPGATIRYARRGDAFKEHSDPTNGTLTGLPLAIWIIQFNKDKFRVEEREFNPFTQAERHVEVTLRPR